MLILEGSPVHAAPSCFPPECSSTQQQGFLVEGLTKALLAEIQLWQIVEASASDWANSDWVLMDIYTSTNSNA